MFSLCKESAIWAILVVMPEIVRRIWKEVAFTRKKGKITHKVGKNNRSKNGSVVQVVPRAHYPDG